LVAALRDTPVAWLVAVTFAPCTAPPEGSKTVPARLTVFTCAQPLALPIHKQQIATNHAQASFRKRIAAPLN
jgi:hypothetical protein